jgi:hypothetical protein
MLGRKGKSINGPVQLISCPLAKRASRVVLCLLSLGCNLADRRFATVAEVAKGRLDAGYLCYAPLCVSTLLLQVGSARFCGRGGFRHQILTWFGEFGQVLLDAAGDSPLTGFDVCTMLFDVTHTRFCTFLRSGVCSEQQQG